jgi:hypothetical protein
MTAGSPRGTRAAALAASLLALVGAVAAPGCGSRGPGPAIEEPSMEDTSHQLPQPPDSCVNVHDCDTVDACCRCDEGGKRLAIRADAVADFMVERQARCAGVQCVQMTSNDLSCKGELVCGNYGRCRFVPPHQF